MNTNKSFFLSQHFLAMKISNIFNEKVKNSLLSTKSNKTFFPVPATLYDKEIVKERFKELKCANEENSNLETVKFNSSNAILDRNNEKSLNEVKSFLSFNSSYYQIQSKNLKNNYDNSISYINHISAFTNPIIHSKAMFTNCNNNNILFKNKSNNSLNILNNPINNIGNLSSNCLGNSKITKESSFVNNSNILNKTLNQKNTSINNININLSYLYLNKIYNSNNCNNKENSILISNNSQTNFSNVKKCNFINSNQPENYSNLFKKKNIKIQEKNILENSKIENNFLDKNNKSLEYSFYSQSNFNSENSSTRNFSSNYINTDYSKNENFQNANKIIYSKRRNSRFFNNQKQISDSLNSTNDSVHVPEFISDLISKKFSNFTLLKRNINDDEEVDYDNFLLKNLDENNHWTNFIYSFRDIKLEEYNLLNKFNSA